MDTDHLELNHSETHQDANPLILFCDQISFSADTLIGLIE